MKIEVQLVCLDLSKQLKEAGYKQEGVWWWFKKGKVGLVEIPFEENGVPLTYIVAPTVAELGRALPPIVIKNKEWYSTELTHQDSTIKNCWYISYYSVIKGSMLTHLYHIDTEANARAKCWLYLKKENLLTKECDL